LYLQVAKLITSRTFWLHVPVTPFVTNRRRWQRRMGSL
jgi:hypothetical protein